MIAHGRCLLPMLVLAGTAALASALAADETTYTGTRVVGNDRSP